MSCIIPFKQLIFVSPTNSLYTEPAVQRKDLETEIRLKTNYIKINDEAQRSILHHKKKKMKKKTNITGKVIKATALVALTLGSFLLKASNGNEIAVETERTIKEHVKFPKLILPIQQQQKIEVVFTTSENGNVNFVFAKTDDKEAKAEIEKQFAKLNLSKLKANVAYSVVLNFKTI
jgi:hypothetical protein